MIDPSIVLGVHVTPSPDPLEAQLRLQNLRQMAQQQQLTAEQLKAAQMENQQKQIALNDQKAQSAAAQEIFGGSTQAPATSASGPATMPNPSAPPMTNYDFVNMTNNGVAPSGTPAPSAASSTPPSMLDKQQALLQAAARHGMSYAGLQALQNQITETRTKMQALDKDEIANRLAHNTAIQSRLAPILAETDPAKQEALWNQGLIDSVNANDMPLEEARRHPYPGVEGVKRYVAGLNYEKWALTSKDLADARDKNTAADVSRERQDNEAPGQKANAAKAGTEADDAQVRSIATVLAGSPDQATYQAALFHYARQYPNLNLLGRFGLAYNRKAILGQGQDPNQIVASDQAAANAAETARHNKVDEGLSATRTGIERARLVIDQNKFNMEFGNDAIGAWVNAMRQDPEAWKNVPAPLKTAVSARWQNETGLPTPRDLPSNMRDREANALYTQQMIGNIKNLLNDPDLKNAVGPILGRLGNLEQQVGDTFFKSGPQAQKEQQLRTSLKYFLYGEGKALLGGRPAEGLIKDLEHSSANTAQSRDMMLGALNGADQASQAVLDSAHNYRFGQTVGARPAPVAGGKGAPAPAAAAPGRNRGNF